MVMTLGKFAKNYCHKGKKDTKYGRHTLYTVYGSRMYAFMRDYVYEYLHLILMFTFTLAAVINLLVLVK